MRFEAWHSPGRARGPMDLFLQMFRCEAPGESQWTARKQNHLNTRLDVLMQQGPLGLFPDPSFRPASQLSTSSARLQPPSKAWVPGGWGRPQRYSLSEVGAVGLVRGGRGRPL